VSRAASISKTRERGGFSRSTISRTFDSTRVFLAGEQFRQRSIRILTRAPSHTDSRHDSRAASNVQSYQLK
jgi:hypothetical protein